MQTGFAVTYPADNLRSVFLVFFPHFLNISLVFPRDLSVKIVPLLDVHQLLMLFAGTLTYSGPGTFSSIIFIMLKVKKGEAIPVTGRGGP
jgi:hypothetical protein